MFKCSECGCEYEVKPDFCDCGNNIFEEINIEKYESHFKKPDFLVNKLELVSFLIFILCIIISILILLFFPKITPKIADNSNFQIKKQISDNIPDLNTFWVNNSPQINREEDIDESEKKVLDDVKPAVKNIVKPQTKTIQTQQKKQQNPNSVIKPQEKKQIVKKTVNRTNQIKSVDVELLNYINGLMNRFKSNITFGEIEGEGSCTVEFSIDYNGKLINRNFSKKSDNKSINDAVYKMLMRTPVYSPPPGSYSGQLIKMYIKLSPEYYEIKLLN